MPPINAHLKQATNLIFVQVAAIYLLVAAVAWLVSTLEPGPNPTFLLCSLAAWSIIGWCQFALFNALHEGLHNRFGSPHHNLPCYALTAYPMGFDDSYRRIHLDHHKYFGDPDHDPDFPNYGNFPRTRRAFLLRLLLNLCGWFALLQFLGLRQNSVETDKQQQGNPSQGNMIKVLATQGILFLLFSVSIGWFYYVWLWLIPLVTFGKFFTSTRAFCEHGSPEGVPVIRTITGPYLQEKILGIFCFNYHAEHHHSVGIPYHRLAQAHTLLEDELYHSSKHTGARYEYYDGGYLRLLFQWFRALPA